MAKVSITTLDEATPRAVAMGVKGGSETRAYFDEERDPIHVHLHSLRRSATMRIGPMPVDCSVYVWKGAVEAGGECLPSQSSLVVEHGAVLDLVGLDDDSQLVSFAAGAPSSDTKAGGHVHLLPAERVARTDNLAGAAVKGALHADAACPTCSVWLHESSMPAPNKPPAAGGIHAHSENEVIFVTSGALQFGTKTCGPATALAISADAFYSFSPGPEGLSFINFRAGLPDMVRFKSGAKVDEVSYWRPLGTPDYLSPRLV